MTQDEIQDILAVRRDPLNGTMYVFFTKKGTYVPDELALAGDVLLEIQVSIDQMPELAFVDTRGGQA